MKLSRRKLLTLSLLPSVPLVGKTDSVSAVLPELKIYGTHTGRISSDIPTMSEVKRISSTEDRVVRLSRVSPRLFDVSHFS